ALGDPKLSAAAKLQIDDPANEKFISPAAYWELAIKISVGKYALHQPYEDFLQDNIDGNGSIILLIHWRHTALDEPAVSPSGSLRPPHDRASLGGTDVDRQQRGDFRSIRRPTCLVGVAALIRQRAAIPAD